MVCSTFGRWNRIEEGESKRRSASEKTRIDMTNKWKMNKMNKKRKKKKKKMAKETKRGRQERDRAEGG